MKTERFIPWLLLALTLIFCGVSLTGRFRVERGNRAVGIAVEMNALRDIAASEGLPVAEILRTAKEHGLTHVVLNEENFGELMDENLIQQGEPTKFWFNTTMVNQKAAERMISMVRLRYPRALASTVPPGLVLDISLPTLRGTSLGINEADAKLVKLTGLEIIARHANPPLASEDLIRNTLRRSKELGASVYLPVGDDVLGHSANTKYTSEVLKELDIALATPEFVNLNGDEKLAAFSKENILRLHSIQAAEIPRYTLEGILERYTKAFAERNIRLLLVRPRLDAGTGPKMSLYMLLDKLQTSIAKEGGDVKLPRPFTEPDPSPKNYWLPIALVAGFFCAVSLQTVSWLGRFRTGFFLLPALTSVASLHPTGRQVDALLFATLFPICAYVLLKEFEKFHWLMGYFLITLISWTGGLCVAALLNELVYYIRIEQMLGVKLAHFFPIIAVALVMLARVIRPKDIVKCPITYGSAILGIVALGVVGFMLARTGNDNPAAVSGLELKFRALLENVMPVRPRTKEFMLGHPVIVLGLWVWSRYRRQGAQWMGILGALLLAAGAIAQTSVVNTMCHLHTSLLVSVERIGIGWLLGGIFGIFLIAVTSLVWKRVGHAPEGLNERDSNAVG